MNNLGVSYLFWAGWLIGLSGLHRLYNGKIGTGLLWLFTGGLLGIGQVVDLLLIPSMVDEHNANIREKLGVSSAGIPMYHQASAAIAQALVKQTPEQLTVKLLKVADAKGGKVSVTQGVMATGASFAEVEATLTELLKTGYVSIENDPITGIVIYNFHEL
ncbi:MAG TPA: NINE protein [Kamptonema sp.]|nr:NINE protein [Kamptonema sp.]